MAIPKVKATYSLDIATMRVLEGAALRWGVSKSEALRRAIHASAALAAQPDSHNARLSLLDQLQASAALDPTTASAWERNIRAERRANDAGTRSD